MAIGQITYHNKQTTKNSVLASSPLPVGTPLEHILIIFFKVLGVLVGFWTKCFCTLPDLGGFLLPRGFLYRIILYYARHISSEFTKLNLQKPKWYDNQTTIAVRRHGMYIPSSKFFAKFFLAFSHCFLLSEPPSIHFLWCWPGLYSCLWLFQGLWLCGSVDLCPCFVPALVCLPLGPCVPSGSTFLVLVPWSPGCSIIPTRMFNGSGLMPLPA